LKMFVLGQVELRHGSINRQGKELCVDRMRRVEAGDEGVEVSVEVNLYGASISSRRSTKKKSESRVIVLLSATTYRNGGEA
jgi:hypothetical protein